MYVVGIYMLRWIDIYIVYAKFLYTKRTQSICYIEHNNNAYITFSFTVRVYI